MNEGQGEASAVSIAQAAVERARTALHDLEASKADAPTLRGAGAVLAACEAQLARSQAEDLARGKATAQAKIAARLNACAAELSALAREIEGV